MPSRCRSDSSYCRVRAWPSGRFDAKIRSGEERIRIGTFDIAHEAARAYDAVAWRLELFPPTHELRRRLDARAAEMLAPPSPIVTTEQRRRAHELEQRLRVAEQDERVRLEWARAFPEDVAAIEAFYAQKKEAKAKAAAKKKADRDRRRAESAARKAERAEKVARRAKRAEEKRGVGPSTNMPTSSSAGVRHDSD
nr:uncharacterized protein LOC127309955 [Lolium perenne]